MQVASFQAGCLNPPSKLKDIEDQLRSLHGKFLLLRLVDNARDGGDVGGLLEDLQEAVNNYMVRSQLCYALLDVDRKSTDGATNGDLRPRV